MKISRKLRAFLEGFSSISLFPYNDIEIEKPRRPRSDNEALREDLKQVENDFKKVSKYFKKK